MKHLLLTGVLIFAIGTTAWAQSEDQGQTSTMMSEAQAEAQRELYKADSAFSANKFTVARRHAEKSVELNPENLGGLIIIARSLRALYRADDESPANLVRAREAIAAFLRASSDPDDEEVYDAVKDLYEATGENELQYAWIVQRANSYSLPIPKRVDAAVELAGLDLNASKKIGESVTEILYDKEKSYLNLSRLDSNTRDEIKRAQELATRGLQIIRKAISLDSESEPAIAREVELLISMSRLFELEGNAEQAADKKTEARQIALQAAEAKAKREEIARAKLVTVDCNAICDRAVRTPRPPYPPIARAARATGTVVIDIELDNDGHVVSATAFSGHPLLRAAAVRAALDSTFTRKQTAERSETVFGSLIYNFTLE